MSDQQQISIPKWLANLVSAACGVVVLIATAAIPWAADVAGNISEIKTQVAGNSKLSEVELTYLRDRIVATESQARGLEIRLREVEYMLGTKRTASRPTTP